MENEIQFNTSQENEPRLKNKLLIALLVILPLLVVIFIGFKIYLIKQNSRVVVDQKSIGQSSGAVKEKQNKVTTGNSTVSNRFIYIGQLNDGTETIQVSDGNGSNIKILKELESPKGDDFFYYGFPSPRGTYFFKLSNDSVVMDLTGKKVFALSKRIENNYAGAREVFSVPDRLEYKDVIKWSNDERYLARIKEDNQEKLIIVYDVQKGKQIFQEPVGAVKESEVGDPISTNPKVVWGDNDDTLYSFNDLGIKIITNLDSVPVVKFIPTKVPCLGLAPHGNEFFCHGRMNTIWSDGVDNPANSSSTGSVFKYTLASDILSEPQNVTTKAIEGEYEAEMTFLDNTHLLYTPELGGNSVIDTETGKITNVDSDNKFKIFSNSRGAIISDRREATIPIIYLGQ